MSAEITDLEHFSRIPWCHAHLNEPNTIKITSPSCTPKPDGEDELFARTIRSISTMQAFLAIYKSPKPAQTEMIRDVKYLVTLESGLAGYPGVCHGGIVATILDEVLGLVFIVNKLHGTLPDGIAMTGQLNVKFIKPVPLPGTYLCRAVVSKIDGRKFYVDGVIEDENGTVLASGESIYIALKQKL